MNYCSDCAQKWRSTTILTVRKNNKVVVCGDGQVSLGNTVMKGTARKVRRIGNGKIIVGFAGSAADGVALLERLEAKLNQYAFQLLRASTELAKEWRMDRYLRRLEAMIIVADQFNSLIIAGNGDVIEPETGIAGIGSGGNYAVSAAKALIEIDSLDAEEIARKSMKIAAEICIYTNHSIILESLTCDEKQIERMQLIYDVSAVIIFKFKSASIYKILDVFSENFSDLISSVTITELSDALTKLISFGFISKSDFDCGIYKAEVKDIKDFGINFENHSDVIKNFLESDNWF